MAAPQASATPGPDENADVACEAAHTMPAEAWACTHGADPVTPYPGPPPARDRSEPSRSGPYPEASSPQDEGSPEGSTSSYNIANYGTGSIRCSYGKAGDNSDRRFVAIYAVPHDNPNKRFSTMLPKIRQAIYNASGYMDDEGNEAAQRIKFLCPSGSAAPTVFDISDLAVSDASDSFSKIVDALKARGFKHSNEKYYVFYDAYMGDGSVGGQGQVFGDSRASGDNYNNSIGAMYAIDYSDRGLQAPDWVDSLHEMGHTMGAVQKDSTNSNGHWHCRDESDIMCYAEQGVSTFSSCGLSPQGFERFDCRWNDYYGPFPASGSYLTNHWNIAGGYNDYVYHFAD
jgi:hypothetical protein